MPLLSLQDQQTVRSHLAGITHQVTLLLFTQTFGAPETALIARQVIDEVAALSDLITVEEANFVLDKERAATYGINAIPTVVLLRDGNDTRMRFLGAPAGYEFMSLVEAVLLAGTDDSGLTPANRDLIAASSIEALDIKVFVTPTCPHCPRAVTLAFRMAAEDPRITASCVEATEFIDLSRTYRVTGVPKTVVAGTDVEVLGALPEDDFVKALIAPDLPATPPS